MEMRKRILFLGMLALMISLVFSVAPLVTNSSAQVVAYNWAPFLPNSGNGVTKVSMPFNYSGYSFPEYESFEKLSVYVPMSDGVLIAVDVFLPSGYNGSGPEPTAFPVVFEYTPYQRATINPYTGEIRDRSRSSSVQFLMSYGYAYVVADMRGSGASTDWKLDFMPEIHRDGGELVDWIAAQSWCDGNVGMTGGSYTGWSQTAVAGQMPEALKCIAPAVIPMDGYTGEVYPGGIWCDGFMTLWSEGMWYSERNFYIPGLSNPTAPVVDEDGDGLLYDEIPWDKDASGTFLDDYHPAATWPPQYFDGNGSVRAHIYYFATLDHAIGNLKYSEWTAGGIFIDTHANITHPVYGTVINNTSYELGPNAFVPNISLTGIPIYDIGGWFDIFDRGTTEWYCTMEETNPSKLLMFPGYHGLNGPFWLYLGEDFPNLNLERLRFYDRYLKGIDNGIDKEPPIYIYVMNGGGWRFEDAWPLPQQQLTNFYFEEGNTLALERVNEGYDTYTADFTHDSRYGTNWNPFTGVGGNRWLGAAGFEPNELPIRTDKDLQCLAYTSAPMVQDTEVTGHPIIHFWVSSTADYGDFYVYLEDVDESGEAILITEGLLRAGFADLYNTSEQIYSGDLGFVVKPDLPWHGYEEAQYVDAIFAESNIVELVIDFQPTSWVFKEGHSIRVTIACADWPTFELHPKLSPTNDPSDPDNIVPTITVYRDADHPSFIELPVIPPKDRVFEGYARIKTSEIKYKGPAELYTFETAVYLHFEDQWIKWDVSKHWQCEFTNKKCKFDFLEFYRCWGELGRLCVNVFHCEDCSFALAVGRRVVFYGSGI
ncbi:MAG: CocE/NonD family hydrolase [Candidatus Lokiarchaeia archaeon]